MHVDLHFSIWQRLCVYSCFRCCSSFFAPLVTRFYLCLLTTKIYCFFLRQEQFWLSQDPADGSEPSNQPITGDTICIMRLFLTICVSTMSRVATKDVNIAAIRHWMPADACNLPFRKTLSTKPFDKYLNTIYVSDGIWGRTGARWPIRDRNCSWAGIDWSFMQINGEYHVSNGECHVIRTIPIVDHPSPSISGSDFHAFFGNKMAKK